MEKIDKAIEILQAFKEGKTIEYAEEFEQWEAIESYRELISLLDRDLNIRIKKKSTYRPYANAEEFLKASKEHGLIITDKCQYYLPVIYGKEGVKFEGFITSYEDLLTYYVFEKDGTPCGILEQ